MYHQLSYFQVILRRYCDGSIRNKLLVRMLEKSLPWCKCNPEVFTYFIGRLAGNAAGSIFFHIPYVTAYAMVIIHIGLPGCNSYVFPAAGICTGIGDHYLVTAIGQPLHFRV